MARPKPTIPNFESNRTDDGAPHERLVWRYLDSGFDVVAFVERDTTFAASTDTGKFVGEMTWSSRGRVSLDEAEQFAVTILDGVKRARTMVTNRNNKEHVYEALIDPGFGPVTMSHYARDALLSNAYPTVKLPVK